MNDLVKEVLERELAEANDELRYAKHHLGSSLEAVTRYQLKVDKILDRIRQLTEALES